MRALLTPRRNLAASIVVAALLLGALACLAASMIPLSILTRAMSTMSGSGDAAGTIADRYEGLVRRARITSGLLLLASTVLFWQLQGLARTLQAAWSHVVQNLQQAPRRIAIKARRAWQSHRLESILFMLILAGGVALRLHYLGRDMRHDEAWTYIVYARRPFFLSAILMSEVNHHPLNTMLIQVAVSLFGDSPQVIRLPACLFGIGCIPAGYWVARSNWGRGAALIAAAGIAGASPLIEYSVNARGYSAVTFFGLIMLGAGGRAVRTGSTGAWAAVTLAGMAGMYANPVMMLPGIVAFTWFVLLLPTSGRSRAAFKEIVVAGIALAIGTLCLYLPIFTVSGWDVISSSQGVKARASVAEAMATIPAFMVQLLANWDRDVLPAVALIAILLALLSVVLAQQRRWICPALLLAMTVAALFQFVVVRDPGPERVWLSFLPMALILAAVGLDGILGRLAGTTLAAPGSAALLLTAMAITAVIRSGTLLTSVETAYFPAARQVAHDLATQAPGDLLAITMVRGDEVRYYAAREGLFLTPIREVPPIRYYRPADQRRDGSMILVLDKLLGFCTVEACLSTARNTVPTTGEPEIMRDNPDYVEMRLKLAGPEP